jgi:hypothetical protein
MAESHENLALASGSIAPTGSGTRQCPPRSPQIIEKFGRWFHTRDDQMIWLSRAGNVKQMAFNIVDLLQICVFADRLDPRL